MSFDEQAEQEFWDAIDAHDNQPVALICTACGLEYTGTQKQMEAQGAHLERGAVLCSTCGLQERAFERGRAIGRVEGLSDLNGKMLKEVYELVTVG